ncbi:conserved hypothetical protein [Gammaproteobacteria bacterium]
MSDQNQVPKVNTLHEILIWPLQVIAPSAGDPNLDHWKSLQGTNGQNPWKTLPCAFNGPPHSFKEQYYKEFVTFLPYVQRFLYGENTGSTGYGNSPIHVFHHSEVAQVRLTFQQEIAPVTLLVQRADLLFFYDINIIILIVEVVGKDLPLPVAQEILFRFGRTYPAFWEPNGRAGQCFKQVEWLDCGGQVLATSDYENRDKYLDSVGKYRSPAISQHWEYLLRPLALHQTAGPDVLGYRQIEYHRMPLMAYLSVEDPKTLTRADFVRLALITRSGDSDQLPYSEAALADFEQQYCYDRFWDPHASHGSLNSRYLCCGHAFLVVGKSGESFFTDPEIGILGQFRHQYFLMCLIPHFHKAALHLFSEQLITSISHLDVHRTESLKKFKQEIRNIFSNFLRFTHRYWFHEVSNQAQARDMFKMLTTQLGTSQLYSDINGSLQEMNQYLESDDLRRQAETVVRLTVVMTLSIIGTVTTGFLGMNLLNLSENPFLTKFLFFLAVLIPTTTLTLYTVLKSKAFSEFLDALSHEDLHWKSKLNSLTKIWLNRS